MKQWFALAYVGALGALVVPGSPGHAQTAPRAAFPLADSAAWQAHFEHWVERFLVAREVAAARSDLPASDPEEPLRLIEDIVEEELLALERPNEVPPSLVPRLAARGLGGETIRAAREYAKGEVDAALAILESEELAHDAEAAHLRAQLYDELRADGSPRDRYEVINEYRFAISLDRDLTQAARARVRIAQIFLDLGFLREAAAALRPHLDPPLPRPYDVPAALTYSEASFRAGRYAEARATLVAIDRSRLLRTMVPFVLRRKSELDFKLASYAQAAASYAEYVALLATRDESPDLLTELRYGYALFRSERAADGRAILERVFERNLDHPLGPFLGVLLIEMFAAENAWAVVVRLADQVLARYPDSRAATMAGTYLLESFRIRKDERDTPESVTRLADFETEDPARGLLSYRVELHRTRREIATSKQTFERLAQLANALPDGPVQALVHDELARRLLERVAEFSKDGRTPSAEVMDAIENNLSARVMEENHLLIAIEALLSTGRYERCASWSVALRAREQRPVRKGLGAWRQLQCKLALGAEAASGDLLLKLADGGEAGPFALAFAALAGEESIRAGDVPAAIRIYERALESFTEPQILGPVLLRLGELHASLGRNALAGRRLVRGLTITDSAETVGDPFRKIGLVTLARIADADKKNARLADLIARDRPRIDAWWGAAYGFLGARVGAAKPPVSSESREDDVFVRGARLIAALAPLEARLREVIARGPAPASAEGTP